MRIPREYEFPGDEVLVYREGDRLILEQTERRSRLLDLLQRLEPVEDAFPDVDEGVQPLDPGRAGRARSSGAARRGR